MNQYCVTVTTFGGGGDFYIPVPCACFMFYLVSLPFAFRPNWSGATAVVVPSSSLVRLTPVEETTDSLSCDCFCFLFCLHGGVFVGEGESSVSEGSVAQARYEQTPFRIALLYSSSRTALQFNTRAAVSACG